MQKVGKLEELNGIVLVGYLARNELQAVDTSEVCKDMRKALAGVQCDQACVVALGGGGFEMEPSCWNV